MVLLMTYIRPPRKEGSDRNKFIGWVEVPHSIVGDFYMLCAAPERWVLRNGEGGRKGFKNGQALA